ncbi:MAG: Ig-like domain-containing protein, partial [Methanomassiliicoccales archaeon]
MGDWIMGNEEIPQKDHLGNNGKAKISWLGHIKISSSQLKWGIAAIAVVIIGFIIWSSFNGSRPKSANAGEITITALQQNENGVKRESSFLLTCENPINMSVVKSSLQIAPALGYDIKEKDSRNFEIVPREKLAVNTVYKFAFDPSNKAQESLSWAFQTIGSFTLLGTMPRTETVGVPVDTGIEFTFSQEDFDLNQAIKYITITPKTEGRFEKHKQTLVFIPQSLQPATLYTVTLKKGLPQKDGRESIVENHILRFETNSTTATEHEFIFDLENRLTEFNTKQTPTFPVSFGTGATVPHPQVDIYRYPDADSFGQAMNSIAKIPYWCSYADSKFRQ